MAINVKNDSQNVEIMLQVVDIIIKTIRKVHLNVMEIAKTVNEESGGILELDTAIQRKKMETGMGFDRVMKKGEATERYTQKVVDLSSNTVKETTVEYLAGESIGSGYTIYKNGLKYTGLFLNNAPYLIGVVTETNGQSSVRIDYDREYGLEPMDVSEWSKTPKGLGEILSFLEEQVDKKVLPESFGTGVLQTVKLVLDTKSEDALNAKARLLAANYLEGVNVILHTDEDLKLLQMLTIKLDSAFHQELAKYTFKIEYKQDGTETKLFGNDFADIMSLIFTSADYFQKHGCYLLPLKGFAELIQTPVIEWRLDYLSKALNLSKNEYYIALDLNNKAEKLFYCSGKLIETDLRFKYALNSLSNRAIESVESLKELDSLLIGNASRWTGYKLNIEVTNGPIHERIFEVASGKIGVAAKFLLH